jgi:hypothetical protein
MRRCAVPGLNGKSFFTISSNCPCSSLFGPSLASASNRPTAKIPSRVLFQAAEIKLRAQRRLGEMGKELPKGAGRPSGKILPASGKNKAEALKAAGLATSSMHRNEQIASIPEEALEKYISDKREKKRAAPAICETKWSR